VTALLVFLSIVVVVAGIVARLRVVAEERRGAPVLDDEAIRRIQEEGRLWVEADDPLDPEEILREEERFWEEEWQEPREEEEWEGW